MHFISVLCYYCARLEEVYESSFNLVENLSYNISQMPFYTDLLSSRIDNFRNKLLNDILTVMHLCN